MRQVGVGDFDICLIVEGTHPNAIGGVSSWVRDLTAATSSMRVAIVRIGVGNKMARVTLSESAPTLFEIAAPAHPLRLESWAEGTASTLPYAKVYHAVGAGLAGLLGLEARRVFGAPLMLSEHANYVREICLSSPRLESGLEVPSGVELARFTTLFKTIARRLYAEADCIVALDQDSRDRQIAGGASKERTRVIPNGVRIPRSSYKPPVDPNRVAYFGRIHSIKGTDRFLVIADMMRKIRHELYFDVIGPWDCDDSFAYQCRALAAPLEDRIRFLGARRRFDFGESLPSVLIVPSRSEAQPLVVLEAFALGIPVVVSDVGGCRLMCESEGKKAALVVENGNLPCMAGAALRILREKSLAEELRRNARRFVEQRFGLASMQESYLALYSEILEKDGVSQCA